VQALVEQKIAGEEVAETPESTTPRAQVIDLMDALKESLAKRGLSAEDAAAKKPPAKAGAAATAKAKPAEAPKKRAQGGRK